MTDNVQNLAAGEGSRRKLWTLLAIFVLVGVGFGAYSNSFSGAFVFDDSIAILMNPAVYRIWPLFEVFGEFSSSRPIVDVSLKINMALASVSQDGKPNELGFHIFNLAVHLLAGLTLFGLVRRTLRTDKLKAVFGKYSSPLALAVALIWLVHPLQTMAVTYIIQRAESMMGLFYLLTLYCAVRSFSSSRPGPWIAASAVACFLGVGCKQVIVTVPLMVLVYDWIFISGTLAKAIRKHRLIYILLFSSWIPVFLMSINAMFSSDHAGFAMKEVTFENYVASQPGVILHYLRLALWPGGLCLDYLWLPAKTMSDILPPMFIVALLLIGCVLGLKYRPLLGFVGAWFFLILAPTSSFMPIRDLAVEHRMYLSLAAVVALVVLGGYWIVDKLFEKASSHNPGLHALVIMLILAGGSSLVLAGATYQRNKAYESSISIWSDVIATRPKNCRAYHNRGVELEFIGRRSEAINDFLRALWLNPIYVDANHSLAKSYYESGKIDEAIEYYLKTLQLKPGHANANSSLTELYRQKGALDEAWSYGQTALANRESFVKPKDLPGLYVNLGNVRIDQGLYKEALEFFDQAVDIQPWFVPALNGIAVAKDQLGLESEAIEQFKSVLEIAPGYAEARVNLGNVYARIGQPDLAAEQYELALQNEDLFKDKAELARVYARLGSVLAKLQRYDESISCFEKAIQLHPDLPGAAKAIEQVKRLGAHQVDN